MPSQAVADREVAAGRVEHHLGHDERAETRSGPFSISSLHLLFDLVQAADAAAEDHAAAVGVFLGEIEARIAAPPRCPATIANCAKRSSRLISSCGRLRRSAGQLRVPVVDVAAELDLEPLGVEDAQRMDAALARAGGACQRSSTWQAERRDDSPGR